MWALTTARIECQEALPMLQRYRERNTFQSNSWLLARHLPLFGVHECYPARLQIPTAGLLAKPPCAVPLAFLPAFVQRRLYHEFPPPAVPSGRFAFLEPGATQPRWRQATVAECFDAAFVQSGKAFAPLLCDPSYAKAVVLPEEVSVLNAQETSNPFLIDSGLAHRDALTGEPFQDSVSSALTTIAAQFRYTSFDWLDASVVAQRQLPLAASAAPHLVNCVELMQLAHVSQLPAMQQEALVDSVPRYVLLNCQKKPYVFTGGKWVSGAMLELTRRLRASDIPRCCSGGHQPLQLLLWVEVKDDSQLSGPAMRCERSIYRKFYNAQQLLPSALG